MYRSLFEDYNEEPTKEIKIMDINDIKKLIENIKELNIPQLNNDITKILLKGGEKTSKIL